MHHLHYDNPEHQPSRGGHNRTQEPTAECECDFFSIFFRVVRFTPLFIKKEYRLHNISEKLPKKDAFGNHSLDNVERSYSKDEDDESDGVSFINLG